MGCRVCAEFLAGRGVWRAGVRVLSAVGKWIAVEDIGQRSCFLVGERGWKGMVDVRTFLGEDGGERAGVSCFVRSGTEGRERVRSCWNERDRSRGIKHEDVERIFACTRTLKMIVSLWSKNIFSESRKQHFFSSSLE